MPRFGPIKRLDLIRNLKRLGFEGPYSGGKHQFMARADVTIRVRNPHEGDIGRSLLARILRQAGASRQIRSLPPGRGKVGMGVERRGTSQLSPIGLVAELLGHSPIDAIPTSLRP